MAAVTGTGRGYLRQEVSIKLDIEEKKVLYAFGCSSYSNTVTCLKWLTSFTVEPGVKHRMLGLVRKLEEKEAGNGTAGFMAGYIWKWKDISGQRGI